mmetsp:Transcript_116682/g.277352  ORF Transcript_116682/g.277352 Transcript_116682/m.277352 type:complete len:83 (+) Transcript_116682:73-321(+)
MSSASRAGMELLDDGELHELNLKKFLKLVHQQPQEFERMIKGLRRQYRDKPAVEGVQVHESKSCTLLSGCSLTTCKPQVVCL